MISFANKVCLCLVNLLALPVIHKQLELSLSHQILPFPLACWLLALISSMQARNGERKKIGRGFSTSWGKLASLYIRVKCVYFIQVMDEIQMVPHLFEDLFII